MSARLSRTTGLVQIRALAKIRAPFAATSDYIGPNWRQLKRETSKNSLFDVPNPLHEKIAGVWAPNRFDKNIKSAVGDLSARRIDHLAEDIMILAGLMADQSAPRGTSLMEANLDRLANMVVYMDRGASNQGFYHV